MVKTSSATSLAALFLYAGFLSHAASPPPAQRGTGHEWVSWVPEQRLAFVEGFLTGYIAGTRDACNATNYIWEVGKVHRIGDDPSARCLARLEPFSKDPDSYAKVLTDFYTPHPEYRGIPVVYLMRFLTDREFKEADRLYQMARNGELRTNF